MNYQRKQKIYLIWNIMIRLVSLWTLCRLAIRYYVFLNSTKGYFEPPEATMMSLKHLPVIYPYILLFLIIAGIFYGYFVLKKKQIWLDLIYPLLALLLYVLVIYI